MSIILTQSHKSKQGAISVQYCFEKVYCFNSHELYPYKTQSEAGFNPVFLKNFNFKYYQQYSLQITLEEFYETQTRARNNVNSLRIIGIKSVGATPKIDYNAAEGSFIVNNSINLITGNTLIVNSIPAPCEIWLYLTAIEKNPIPVNNTHYTVKVKYDYSAINY